MNERAKQILIIVVVALGLVVGAFLVGRSTAPVKIERQVVEKIVEVEKEKIVYTDKLVFIEATNKQADTKRDTHTVIQPDGTTVIDEHEHTATSEETIKYVDRIVEKVVEKEKLVFKDRLVYEKIESAKAQWRVGVQAGLDISSLKDPGNLYVVGAQIDRRILGPFFLGAWGNTKLQTGIGLSFEF